MKVWIIDSMGCKARICISIDDKEPELLVGPDILENEELFNIILLKTREVLIKQNNIKEPG